MRAHKRWVRANCARYGVARHHFASISSPNFWDKRTASCWAAMSARGPPLFYRLVVFVTWANLSGRWRGHGFNLDNFRWAVILPVTFAGTGRAAFGWSYTPSGLFVLRCRLLHSS